MGVFELQMGVATGRMAATSEDLSDALDAWFTSYSPVTRVHMPGGVTKFLSVRHAVLRLDSGAMGVR